MKFWVYQDFIVELDGWTLKFLGAYYEEDERVCLQIGNEGKFILVFFFIYNILDGGPKFKVVVEETHRYTGLVLRESRQELESYDDDGEQVVNYWSDGDHEREWYATEIRFNITLL